MRCNTHEYIYTHIWWRTKDDGLHRYRLATVKSEWETRSFTRFSSEGPVLPAGQFGTTARTASYMRKNVLCVQYLTIRLYIAFIHVYVRHRETFIRVSDHAWIHSRILNVSEVSIIKTAHRITAIIRLILFFHFISIYYYTFFFIDVLVFIFNWSYKRWRAIFILHYRYERSTLGIDITRLLTGSSDKDN